MEYTKAGELRILLATHEDLRETVNETVHNGLGDARIYWASQAVIMLGRAVELTPDVVLLDQDLAGGNTAALVQELLRCAPRVVTLVLTTAEQLPEASRAILAGARGFLFKPLQPSDLLHALHEVLDASQGGAEATPSVHKDAHGRVLVFCSPKGGTGRTTLAINTAISLAARAKAPVAMVDADYAAPALDVSLSLNAEHTIADLLPGLAQLDEAMLSGLMTTHSSGIQVLLAPQAGHYDDVSLTPQGIQRILDVLRRMFPWVVVDLGLPMDEVAFAFLDNADRILVTLQPEMVGLRNAELLFEQLESHGYPKDRMWLVMNRATMKGGLERQDIEQFLGHEVHSTIPDAQSLVTRSVNRGIPVAVSHKHSNLAQAVRGLVQRLYTDPTLGGVPEVQRGGSRPLIPLWNLFHRQAGREAVPASASLPSLAPSTTGS